MINFSRFSLDNGLRILVHEDSSTNLAAFNLLYDVGSRDEDPGLTGLAHLLEHLMFSGTPNIPSYDLPLQMAGGENNAYTNNDITNFYLTVPSENIETGFWLESDRMTELDFSEKNLNIQKSVVIEEFNQRYLNQPYGDAMLLLRPLAYKLHSYLWPTIGKDVSHIEKLRVDHVRDFFLRHYAPNNAILSVTGNIKTDKIQALTEKWFGPIDGRVIKPREIPAEPLQESERIITVEKDVPIDAIYKAWHICPRKSEDFCTLDVLTDLLAGGESGRLTTKLIREKCIFSEINAYLTSDIDPGLLIMSGKLMKGVSVSEAEGSINGIIKDLKVNPVPEAEMEKVRNKFESSLIFSNTSILNKAMNLSYFELIGDASLVNKEVTKYRAVDKDMVKAAAEKYLNDSNCCTIHYLSAGRN
jgi:predicted Zn-dependent peptidase